MHAQAKVRGSIIFANVTFRYPSPLAYRDALHDVNFAITVWLALLNRTATTEWWFCQKRNSLGCDSQAVILCDLQAGQSCGIVGTRGSGKTTLLHMILRL